MKHLHIRLAAALITLVMYLPSAFTQPLSGTYQVGPGAPVYTTIQQAVDALTTNGTSGPVTFSLEPHTYNEKIEITSFTRSGSPTDEVLFRPNNPNAIVIWTASTATSGSNYVLKLDNVDHIRFRNIEFEVHASAGSNARLIDLEDNVEEVTIELCDFRGLLGASGSTGSLIYRSGDNIDDLLVQDNAFFYGSSGINLDGSVRQVDATRIIGNSFAGQYDYGVQLDMTDDTVVDGNSFISTTAGTGTGYIAIASDAFGITVTNNLIDLQKGHTAIWLWALNNTTGIASPVLVANNAVNMKSSSASRGVFIASNNVQIVHNTIRVNGALAEALDVDARSEITIRNNLLINDGAGPAITVASGADIVESDYNNFYSGGGGVLADWDGLDYATLADLQAGISGDLDDHSSSTAVSFVATTGVSNLHLDGSSPDDVELLATPFPGIIEDLDGTTRGTFTTFMGAYEGNSIAAMDNADTGAGFYTVAGSTPDFTTVSEAVLNLNRRGIKGTVTFRIRAGTHQVHETIDFRRAHPSTGTDSVLFRASNPNSKPVLQHAATGTSDNWLFRIVEADSVNFKNLVMEATGVGIYGRLIRLDGDVDQFSLRQSTLNGITGQTSTEAALVWSYSGSQDDLMFRGNTLNDGSVALSLMYQQSASTPVGEDSNFINNTFLDQTVGAMELQQNYIVIEDNVIDGDATGYTGVYIRYTKGANIHRNSVDARGTGSFGIRLFSVNGRSFSKPGLITNNFITSRTGISLEDTSNLWYTFHNTIRCNTYCFYAPDSGGELHLVDNLLIGFAGGGIPILVGDGADIVTSDFNNLFARSGGPLADWEGSPYSSLATLRAASGHDLNSVSLDVDFVDGSANDLHLDGASIGEVQLAGTPVTWVTDDFDEETRSLIAPYIGADEASIPLASDILADITVLLEGAWSDATSDMTTSLNMAGHLPLTQPYDAEPWEYPGTESVLAGFFAAHTDIVDWVLVRLRSGSPTDGYMEIEAARAAFLLEDGSVVALDGTSLPGFPSLAPGTYWIEIFHRNHLAMMSSVAVDFSSGTGTHNFTVNVDPSTPPHYGNDTQQEIEPGLWAMYAGDANGSIGVTTEDYATWLTENNGSGYLLADFNLSGGVTAEDYVFWLANNNTSGLIIPGPP